MNFEHWTQDDRGSFMVPGEGEQPRAEITYRRDGASLVVTHTGVSDELRGEGVGTLLVEQIAEYARQEEMTIVARCPFARDVLMGRDDLRDVLAEA